MNQQQRTIVAQLQQYGQILADRVNAQLALALVLALVVPVLVCGSPCRPPVLESGFASTANIGHCALLHHTEPADTPVHCHGLCLVYAITSLTVVRIGVLLLAYCLGACVTLVVGRLSAPPVPPPRWLASSF